MLFTTSWDDGHPDDFRVADALEQRGMTGTFYVCRDGQAGARLSDDQIRELAKRHEVGAHTLTHPRLPLLSHDQCVDEIVGSKQWIEQITGRPCTLFAYPYGSVSPVARDVVRSAGFAGARTTQDLSWDRHDHFLLPTTLQVHHFPFRPVWNRRFFQPICMLFPNIRSAQIPLLACRSWLSLARSAYTHAETLPQPWFHLWGHSWSLDRYGLWPKFLEFLDIVSSKSDVRFVTNSELLNTLHLSE